MAKPPPGTGIQLIGSSYDRTIYGFEIETTPEQDDALIRKLNSSPNRSHFRLVSSNCADFAKDIINFYYPKSLHRSLVADAGITTPKQMAKMLTKFEARRPEMRLSRTVIAQVPGSMPRSSTVHGVVESFLKSKKYIVPSAVASPIFAGCVFAVFVGTGAGQFDPGRNALVFNPDGDLESPLTRAERKTYLRQLKSLLAESGSAAPGREIGREWERLQAKAKTDLDDQGAPVLQMQVEGRQVLVGAAAGNVMEPNAPPQLAQAILAARLESELRHSVPRGISGSEVARDCNLLQQAQRVEVKGSFGFSAAAAMPGTVRAAYMSGP